MPPASDKLGNLHAKVWRYEAANRAQAANLAAVKGPHGPYGVFGRPVCARCKLYRAYKASELTLVQALSRNYARLAGLRPKAPSQRRRHERGTTAVMASIKEMEDYLGGAQQQLHQATYQTGYVRENRVCIGLLMHS